MRHAAEVAGELLVVRPCQPDELVDLVVFVLAHQVEVIDLDQSPQRVGELLGIIREGARIPTEHRRELEPLRASVSVKVRRVCEV